MTNLKMHHDKYYTGTIVLNEIYPESCKQSARWDVCTNFAEWQLPVHPHPYVIFNTTKWEKTPGLLYCNISGTGEEVKLEMLSSE